MKKIMISFLIILSIIIVGYIFKDVSVTESEAHTKDRFVKVLDEGQYEIWCDTKTKVLYLQSCVGIGYQGYGGITVLVDADGKPLLYEED